MKANTELVDDSVYIDFLRKKSKDLLGMDVVRFGIVGGLGFVINLTILVILHGYFKVPLLISQLLGAELAILSNFSLHTHWTYKGKHEGTVLRRTILFHGSAWIGSGITTITLLAFVHFGQVFYIEGLILGSFLAMVWNYLWTKHVIFKIKGTE